MRVLEVEAVVRQAVQPVVDNVHDLEVRAFVSGLITSVGLAAINTAMNARDAGEPVSVLAFDASSMQFDFPELSRDRLVSALDASTGLGLDVCAAALQALERTLADRLREYDAIRIERLGMARTATRGGFELELDEDLRVVQESSPVLV